MTDQINEQAAVLLEDSAVLLEKNEWVQGTIREKVRVGATIKDGYCAIGAVGFSLVENWNRYFDVLQDDPVFIKAVRALHEAIFGYWVIDDFGFNVRSVEGWNDFDGRTKQEVLDAIQLAAKKVRS